MSEHPESQSVSHQTDSETPRDFNTHSVRLARRYTTVPEYLARQPTFVGTDRGIELHSKSAIDLRVAVIIVPNNAKLNHTLGLGQPNENVLFVVLCDVG